MKWTVILENERRESLESLSDEFSFESIHSETIQNSFILLKYLDPYGDTFFNSLQMQDLIFDLQKLKDLEKENPLIKDIIILAERCKVQPHTYLSFYGD